MGVNDDILDASLRHTIGLWRYGGTIEKEVLERYDGFQGALLAALAAVGNPIDPLQADVTLIRLAGLFRQEYGAIEALAVENLLEAGAYEADFQRRMMERETKGLLDWEPVDPERLRRGLLAAPIAGLLLRDWFRDLEAKQLRRTRESFRRGVTEGDTLGQALDRVTEDTKLGRHHLETVTRTAFGHATADARDALFEGPNERHLEGFIWLGVLDVHITPGICLPRHEKFYALPGHVPVDHDLPWGTGPGKIHHRCRSIAMPVVKGFGELSFNEDGIPDAELDTFDGEVPRGTSGDEWLRRQPRRFVEDIYGVERADAFLSGRLTAEDLIGRDGRLLTLEELREFDAL